MQCVHPLPVSVALTVSVIEGKPFYRYRSSMVGKCFKHSASNTTNDRMFLVGDGECHEGSVWEAAMFAGHHQLGNLTVVVDRNRQCVTDFTEDCVRLEPLSAKWEAFGWETRSIDGHSCGEILETLRAIGTRENGKPLVIIANTIKGRGVSFMERQLHWHHGIPAPDELETARKELDVDLSGTAMQKGIS